MCGRVFSRLDISDIRTKSNSIISSSTSHYSASYNLGPTRYAAAIIHSSKLNSNYLQPNEFSEAVSTRALCTLKWGITEPRRSSSSKQPLTNIRSETAFQFFPKRVNYSRCVIIAEGYYEWRAKDKHSFAIRRKESDLVYFAGVYEMSSKGEMEFAIITLDPLEDMKWLHDRMPAMIDKNEIDEWISTEHLYEDVRHLVRPREKRELEYYEVPKLVGNIKNDSPECCMNIKEYNEKSKAGGIMRFFTPGVKRKSEEPSPTKKLIPKQTEKIPTENTKDPKDIKSYFNLLDSSSTIRESNTLE